MDSTCCVASAHRGDGDFHRKFTLLAVNSRQLDSPVQDTRLTGLQIALQAALVRLAKTLRMIV